MRARQSLLAFLTLALVIPAALQLAGRIGAAFKLTGPLVQLAIEWKAVVHQIAHEALGFCFNWLDWHPSSNQVEGISLSALLLTASGGPALRAWLLKQERRPPKDDPKWVDQAFFYGTIVVFISFSAPALIGIMDSAPESSTVVFGAAIPNGLILMAFNGTYALIGLIVGVEYLRLARRKVGEKHVWRQTLFAWFMLLCGTAVLFVFLPGADAIYADMPHGALLLSALVPLLVTGAVVASAFLDALAMARVSLGMLATLLGNYLFEVLTKGVHGG